MIKLNHSVYFSKQSIVVSVRKYKGKSIGIEEYSKQLNMIPSGNSKEISTMKLIINKGDQDYEL